VLKLIAGVVVSSGVVKRLSCIVWKWNQMNS